MKRRSCVVAAMVGLACLAWPLETARAQAREGLSRFLRLPSRIVLTRGRGERSDDRRSVQKQPYGRIESLGARSAAGRADIIGGDGRPLAVRIEDARSTLGRGRTGAGGLFTIALSRSLRPGQEVYLLVKGEAMAAFVKVDRETYDPGGTASRPVRGAVTIGAAQVTGWAEDPNEAARAVPVKLFVDRVERGRVLANGSSMEKPRKGFRFEIEPGWLARQKNNLVEVYGQNGAAAGRDWVLLGRQNVAEGGRGTPRFTLGVEPGELSIVQGTTRRATLVFRFAGGTPLREPGVVCTASPQGQGWAVLEQVPGVQAGWGGDGTFRCSAQFSPAMAGTYTFQARSTEGAVACTLLTIRVAESGSGFAMSASPRLLERNKGERRKVSMAFQFRGEAPAHDPGVVLTETPAGPCNVPVNGMESHWAGWDGNTCYLAFEISDDLPDGAYRFRGGSRGGAVATCAITIKTRP